VPELRAPEPRARRPQTANGVSAAAWRRPPARPALTSDDVHVWLASLDVAGSRLKALARTLSGDERERARRYHFRRDRDRYVVCRGVLREILGVYLDRSADSIRLRYRAHGKPALAGEGERNGLRFNVARSGGMALYAVAWGREVGVDLESIRPELATAEIAEQFFSPGEVEALRALHAGEWTDAFFACWTRKEAYVKATGGGLSTGLDTFEVSLAPGAPAALLRAPGAEASRWSLRELTPRPGYIGALAVEGRRGWGLECWTFECWASRD